MDFFCIFVLKITNNREKMTKGKSLYLTQKQISIIKVAIMEHLEGTYEYNDDSEEEQIIYKIIDKLNK